MDATIKINKDKGTIELRFQYRPVTATLDDLKANGFRWSSYTKCWYRADNSRSRRVAAKYVKDGVIEQDQAGDMVQANEEAGFDNWAQANL